MKRFVVLVLLLSVILIAGDKKPAAVYIKRADQLKMIERRANDIQSTRKTLSDSLATLDKEMVFLQGYYAACSAMPDSFVARQDSVQTKK